MLTYLQWYIDLSPYTSVKNGSLRSLIVDGLAVRTFNCLYEESDNA